MDTLEIREVRDRIAAHVRSQRRNRAYFHHSEYWRTTRSDLQDDAIARVSDAIWAVLELAREQFPADHSRARN